MERNEWLPGMPAPYSGLFEEVNIFGRATGVLAVGDQGEPLPGAPRGFAWRPLADLSVAELRARAVRYRDMASAATTEQAMTGLPKLAERLDAMADQSALPRKGYPSNGTAGPPMTGIGFEMIE